MRHVPYWFDRVARSRRQSHPRLRGPQQTRVAIVGGGLTGCACAFVFAAAGIDVTLLEAGTIGGGATGGSDGLLREGFNAPFHAIAARHGVRTSRALWEGSRRGALDMAAALRRLNVRCEAAPMDVLAITAGADGAKELRREQAARKSCGVDAAWLTPRAAMAEAGIESDGALRTKGTALDPYRACVGLAAAAASRGANLHEQSPVQRIRPSAKHVELTTAAGAVRADTVIVATAAPIPDLRALRRHFLGGSIYGVVTEPLPAAIRRQLGRRRTAVEAAGVGGRLMRWVAEDRIMIRGARQIATVPSRLRERTLTQRAGQLMYELSLMYPPISGLQAAWAWDASDYETVDALPFVGPHRNFPRHLFAFTPSRHGAGLAWAAARLLLRHYQGVPAKGDDAFAFTRVL